ncbi:restriction endonuclease subunit S [Rhizobium laguerreae]|uniref:restriction endonuclease subunit S n=1 Tax=Rhizobium laguerreae TaxID=1076926 RepID=UPI001C926A77|nr:restriction endonuclease subunit S [Rhizobium laguerreae]
MTLAAWPTFNGYKPTSIDWQPDAPEHWDVKPLFAVARIISEANQPELELLSVYLGQGVIRFSDVEEKRTNATSADLSKYQVVRPGNLVLNNQQAWRGSVGVSRNTGIVSPAYLVLDLGNRFELGFADYYFRTNSTVVHFLVSSKGVGTIQRNLYWPALRRCPITIPPLPEQRAIAAFLDEKCAKVDEAVRIKEAQIALLRERRQILIQQAVTRGLNPDAPMKDSGVDWIGQIPTHWEVRRSKYVFTQRKELARKDDIQLSATQSYGVIPQDKFEEFVGRRVVKIQTNLEKRKHVEVDDFVISMRSFQGGLERAFAAGCIRSSYVILQPLEPLSADFFGYLLKSPRYIKALQATGSFIRDGQDLNFDNFSKVDLFLPPMHEQVAIAAHIKVGCEKIDYGIAIKEQQIVALREYRTSLIDATVTGKIKVA